MWNTPHDGWGLMIVALIFAAVPVFEIWLRLPCRAVVLHHVEVRGADAPGEHVTVPPWLVGP
jgi:hypothetical protein